MSFINYIILFLIGLSAVMFEYKETKKAYKLWAIPLMAYVFLGIPVLEKFKLGINEILFFVPVVFISIGFACVELRNSKQRV